MNKRQAKKRFKKVLKKGINFKEGIDWNLIENKIPEVTWCNNTPHFCHHDNFISFWELMWNFNCNIEDVCDVVVKI